MLLIEFGEDPLGLLALCLEGADTLPYEDGVNAGLDGRDLALKALVGIERRIENALLGHLTITVGDRAHNGAQSANRPHLNPATLRGSPTLLATARRLLPVRAFPARSLRR